jgi:hypothetical protein
MVGMPATGLGGIFYILLVAWMAVRESWFIVRRKKRTRGARRIVSLGSMATAIVAALWLEGWLLHQFFASTAMPTALSRFTNGLNAEFALGAVAPMLTLAPFVLLAFLFAIVHGVRHVLDYRNRLIAREASLAEIRVRAG